MTFGTGYLSNLSAEIDIWAFIFSILNRINFLIFFNYSIGIYAKSSEKAKLSLQRFDKINPTNSSHYLLLYSL